MEWIKILLRKEKLATGPELGPDVTSTNPTYEQDCVDHITSVPRKKLSLYVSQVMDRLGYNYDMIKCRQRGWAKLDIISNRYAPKLDMIQVTTGGKGEGTSMFYESDIDRMHVINDIICADNPHPFMHQGNIILPLFQTERQHTSPGYTKLKLLKCNVDIIHREISEGLYEAESGVQYLSSKLFIKAVEKRSLQDQNSDISIEKISGPSTPFCTRHVSFDQVFCLRCYCPDILKRWISRHRYQGWPSQASIDEISHLEGHVVPVGCKGSDEMAKEWRICFSLAELHLMRNLNETQLKLYIILKHLSKSVLKKVFEDMTSYIMKNVVLWICEANGAARFTPELLMDRLFDCIYFIRTCVIRKRLPSYMIPERNLLLGRLDHERCQILTSLLSDLLKEGGRLLFRCPKIENGMLSMYTIPDVYRKFGKRKDKVERLKLQTWIILLEIHSVCDMYGEDFDNLFAQSKELQQCRTRVLHLMQVDAFGLILRGKTDEIKDILEIRMKQLLS